MKYPTLLLLALALMACNAKTAKTNGAPPPTPETKEPPKELSIAGAIAHKNGWENWGDVSEINFTFNVDRGENHFERSWSWQPKTNNVALYTATDTVRYNQKNMDSTALKTDAAFINDKYWLLAPFNLAWDENATRSAATKQQAPISKDSLYKITITYGSEGGYTPGDAYDFFYDDGFTVKEWVFRKGNSNKPTMTTTWEEHNVYNGLKISGMHRDSTGNFKLYFTDISVIK
ncbi:MAG: hypothetical protein ACPG7E_00205 [Marinirhabdus sp.]